MQKSNAEIVKDVRLCMDESAENVSELIGSTDNEELDKIIESKLAEAYRWVNVSADDLLLEPENKTESVITDNKGVARLNVPYTILRVLGIKLPSWSRYVSTYIRATDKAYAELSNPITTGTKDNPKVAILNNGDGYGYTFELYGGSGTETATYLYIDDWKDDNNDISDKVYDAMVTYCAGLTFKTFKDAHGDVLMNQAIANIK